MKKYISIILPITCAVLIAIVAVFLLYGGSIAVALISKFGNVNIAYSSIKSSISGRIDFTDFVITNKKSSAGLAAKTATIQPIWREALGGKFSAYFKLGDVNFAKGQSEEKTDYSTLSGLLALPFESKWKYSEITGTITAWRNSIRIEGFKASSDEIKFAITGDLWDDDTIASDITVYFASGLFAKIPADIVRMVLTDENDGWWSLSVHLTGSLKTTSIQVTGKGFRANLDMT